MSAQDDRPLGLIGTFHTADDHQEEEEEEYEDIQSYCPPPRKQIGPAIAFALTLAFILCTMFATGQSLPPQTATQTMKLLKGGEGDEQVLLGREDWSWRESRIISARELSGLGSHPPSCRSKCGKCVPCKPVRVPIHPGRNRPLEYYPEAWRCKCGNKLYMP
ncbi:hypothetical protein SUGI_0924490 [Cryptomeria japonica]|uniref:EPIDERMAL PATTERNING FACTOR-like protein 6 n=1 Tax=Cryptomeria japonica TaxID=3369 RepID=UPI0024146A4B|nr:EPIDERMAL PATTERNING FACTOR-like protein 6 [Cryptomeria japonica]GLJ44245.1 hypothetical protein SUGI_0924490 [Cryptomeria japonica]